MLSLLSQYSRRLHTSRMSLAEDVDLEEFVTAKDDLSGADIKAVCTEAGLLALRERRMRVTKADFTEAREKVCVNSSTYTAGYLLCYRCCIARTRVHPRVSTCSLVVVYVSVATILISFLNLYALFADLPVTFTLH